MPQLTSMTCTLLPKTRTRTALGTSAPSGVFSGLSLPSGANAPDTRTQPSPQSCVVVRVGRTMFVILVTLTLSPAAHTIQPDSISATERRVHIYDAGPRCISYGGTGWG